MQQINNWSQLQKALMQYIPETLEIVAEDVRTTLLQYAKDYWYGREHPAYDRTNELINSITVSPVTHNGNTWTVKIYFDENKIQPSPSSDPDKFPSHMNVTDGVNIYGGASYGYWVPFWENYGESSSIHSYEGINIIEMTENWMQDGRNMLNEFASILSEKTGCKCIVA